MENKQYLLSKGTVIADRYEIQFPIGSNSFSQSYRAKSKSGNIIRLDLINLASLPSSFFEEGKLYQVSLMKKINHTNISALKEDGETIIEKQKFAYLNFDFISGETLAEKLKREAKLSPYEAVPIITELLDAIEFLHNQPDPIIHNSISPTSVILDLSSKREKPVLTGFEQARTLENSNHSISIKGLSFFHAAPELLNGVFIPQSDLFSVGALLHHLLFGVAPWYNDDILSQPLNKVKGMIEQAREKKLSFDFADEDEIDDQLKYTLTKALSIDIDNRFKTAKDFSRALKREVMLEKQVIETSFDKNFAKKEKKKGSGFDQIAGMEELKNILFNEVIRPITEKERFQKFGIPLLNGLLLYGPPGCGKTFIAEKFAEEIGFNFIPVKPDDLASPYVHGGQEKIGKLFKDALEKTPCVIFFDEFDAIVPSREGNDVGHHYAAEVNVMLSHMTECGEKGIFIIAATNRPEKIDKAILRTGRIDKIIYLPPPDGKAREEMFKLYLKSRPADLGVDCEKLALQTANYVSRDLKEIIIEASKKAERTKVERITMQILETAIKEYRPSVTLNDIKKYEALKQQWDNEKQNIEEQNEGKSIGFKIDTKNQ